MIYDLYQVLKFNMFITFQIIKQWSINFIAVKHCNLYIHARTHTCTHAHTRAHANMCGYVRTRIFVHVHEIAFILTYTPANSHLYAHAHMRGYAHANV